MGGIMHSPVELSSLSLDRQIIKHPWNNHRIHRILSQEAGERSCRVKVSGRFFLKKAAAISARLLGMAGVITAGCYQAAEPTYGVPGYSVTLTGTVRSAADSTAVEGIRVRAFSQEISQIVGEQAFTGADGSYSLFVEDYEFAYTDSIGLTADDVDGAENGEFYTSDTLLALPTGDDPELNVDINLQPLE